MKTIDTCMNCGISINSYKIILNALKELTKGMEDASNEDGVNFYEYAKIGNIALKAEAN